MFKLHKLKSDKSRQHRFDFNFSDFHVSQVPKGWDKLFVSIVAVETGKTITKSGKASMQNGNCQWMETLSQSIWISQEDTTKVLEQCLLKFVVAMGAARSSILGEATVNMQCYMSSKASVPVSLPLKKCSHGTTLQLKIQCLTPTTKLRNERSKEANAYMEDANAENDDMDNKSDISYSTLTRSVGSSSSNCLDSSSHDSHPAELGSRDTSFSASGSHDSFDSLEGSLVVEKVSPQNKFNGTTNNLIERQDSTSSQSSSSYGSCHVDDSSRSNHLSFNSKVLRSEWPLQNQNQRDNLRRISPAIAMSPLQSAGSSKDLLEAAELTIKELRAEARMWERNARKLMLDLEMLRQKFSDQSENQVNLEKEVSTSHTECDGLKQEIKQMKILLEESMIKEKATKNLKFQAKDIQKELEDEIRFLNESSANLAVQLKKTQESNIELVAILQELEETIEKQKIEIDNLLAPKSEFEDIRKNGLGHEDFGEAGTREQVLARKMNASYDLDLEGSTIEHPISNLHVEFESEDNRDMEIQLQQLQESQKNLESTIQLMEKALGDKKHEIEIEQDLRTQTLLNCEADWRHKVATKEQEVIVLEARLSEALNAQGLEEMRFKDGSDCNLIKEIKALKEKVWELERDCSEPADENLRLLLKPKERMNDLLSYDASPQSLPNVCLCDNRPYTSESEVSKQKSQMCEIEQELKKEVRMEELAAFHLQAQCKNLENKCADLELQLEVSKDKASYLDGELHRCRAKIEEQVIVITSLQQQLECFQEKEAESKDHHAIERTNFHRSESGADVEISVVFSNLCEQLQLSLAIIEKQQYSVYAPANTEHEYGFNNSEFAKSMEPITQKDQAEALLKKLVQLNNLFEAKMNKSREGVYTSEEEIGKKMTSPAEVHKLMGNNLKDTTLCCSCQGLKNFNMELEGKLADLSKEFLAKFSELVELKADHLLKEEKMEALMDCQRELEIQISNIQKEKSQLEGNMEITLSESSLASKCLGNLWNDMLMLRSRVNSQVLANKILERKSSKLEIDKHELEDHLSNLEEENVQLSERIFGLEAQLRYFTDERESRRLELQHSESYAISLQEQLRRLETDMEAQKADMIQKLLDMQKQWLEAREECEYLKKANPKLQATVESLIEEYSLLQKSNVELQNQKFELHERCTVLEAELRESQKSFSDFSVKIGTLEAKFSSMLEEISLKEDTFYSELDALLHENKKQKEKLNLEESLLHLMFMEKKEEAENLQRKVVHLTEQISATHDEREQTAAEAVFEVSTLRADKAKLEAALHEAQGKLKLSDKKLYALQMESEKKVLELLGELAASKQNQETLVADHEKLLGLLENVKCNEQKNRNIAHGLELKLRLSENERLQLAEEISYLKFQLQSMAALQGEVLALKNSLSEAKFENERLETSFQLLSFDYEELKSERLSFVEKISCMKNAMLESEKFRHGKIALQEKILRLEGDLAAREALCAHNAEMKNELAQTRRTNSQFQRKIKYLEEEKEECMKRVQALEQELKVKQDQSESRDKNSLHPESNVISDTINEELKHSEVDEEQHYNTWGSQVMGVDLVTKIQFLRDELVETLEANDMFKAQLKCVSFDRQKVSSEAPKNLTGQEHHDHRAQLLETELRDIRERYFHMSLKYAEVEAQREELVMKLKAAENERSWIS